MLLKTGAAMKYFIAAILMLCLNLIQNYSQLKEANNLYYLNSDAGNKKSDIGQYLYEGDNSAGVTIGFSMRSKILSYGITYEHYFSQGRLGLIGLGINGRFNTASEDILDNSAKLKTTNISGGIQLNYHFNTLTSAELVPFGGIVLGYNNSGTIYKFNSGSAPAGFENIHKGEVYFFGQAGIRYFFSRNAAVILVLGTGNTYKSAVDLGFDFKF